MQAFVSVVFALSFIINATACVEDTAGSEEAVELSESTADLDSVPTTYSSCAKSCKTSYTKCACTAATNCFRTPATSAQYELQNQACAVQRDACFDGCDQLYP